jgi:hypothetical protein
MKQLVLPPSGIIAEAKVAVINPMHTRHRETKPGML